MNLRKSLGRARTIAVLVIAAATVASAQTPASPAKPPKQPKAARAVELHWDFDATAGHEFEVWVDCGRDANDGFSSCPHGMKNGGADARAFLLRKNDRVVSYARATRNKATFSIEIQNAVSGTNVDDAARTALSKLVMPQDAKKAAPSLTATQAEEVIEQVTFLNDKLLAGGKLTTTFVLKTKGDGGKTSVDAQSPAIPLDVMDEAPWFSMSYGLGLSTARHSQVTIVKTNTIVTFNKNGTPTQAYQQQVHVSDASSGLRPIEAAVAFVGLRTYRRLYFIAGFQTTSNIFTEPLLGAGCRLKLGGKMAVMITGGAHFSKETDLIPGTGFSDGTPLDPSLALTPGDIPTETRHHVRAYLGFGIEF